MTAKSSKKLIDRRKQMITLFLENGNLSKNDIFKMTRYSISTVIATVDEMCAAGLIVPVGMNQPAVGRPALAYSLNPDYGYSIGLDINSSYICAALVNFKHETVKTTKQRVPQTITTLKGIVEFLPCLIDELLANFDTPPRILCIGIAAPGLVDIDSGTILLYSHFPDEQNVDVVSALKKRYNCYVYIDKSLNCLATCYQKKVPQSPKDMILISIRTGVGMSCILNGSIYRGANGMAGEIGHMRIPGSSSSYRGSPIGSLDAEVSIYSITKKMEAVFGELKDETGGPLSTAQKMDLFLRFVQNKQPECIRILDEICYYLGYAVNQIINLFNPSQILFYGEITGCGDTFLSHLRNYIESDALCPGSQNVSLGIANLTKFAFAEGASYYAFSRYLHPESPSQL